MTEKTVFTSSAQETMTLFGAFDENAKEIEKAFDVRISNRKWESGEGDAIIISGEKSATERAARVFALLSKMAGDGETVSRDALSYAILTVKDGDDSGDDSFSSDVIIVTNRGKPIKAKTAGQKKYVDMIRKETVVLGTGPAGTGKTFLAVAMAVEALRNKQVDRIILTRPAVEAGERLGFLPGDLQSKIEPYLRPLYDALFEMLGAENYQRHMERGTIEIAPLAYMRGRTLDNSFIILDEAQNTTPEQMKMFLTRLGNNAKAVVTGDLSQTDLSVGQKSGLAIASRILHGVDGVGIFAFTSKDVVRHPLVARIIRAYEAYENERTDKNVQENEMRTTTMKTLNVRFSETGDFPEVGIRLKMLLRRAIRKTLESENFPYSAAVSVTFCDNTYIHELNKTYRNVDRPTDVLSFPLYADGQFDEEECRRCAVLGDIVLSLEKAKEQATEYGHSFYHEAAFLTVHSTLHLLGYDHEKSPADEEIQCQKQKNIMEKMHI